MTHKRDYRFNEEAIHAIKEIQRLVEQPDTTSDVDALLSFDPESDIADPVQEARLRGMLGDVADSANIPRDIAYAIRQTGLVVTDAGLILPIHSCLKVIMRSIRDARRAGR